METTLTPEPRRRSRGRFLRRAGSALAWLAALVLGLFGIVFTFVNYPWIGVGMVLLLFALVGSSERKRRERRARVDRARERNRAGRRGLPDD